jgi:hypothetical protein
MQQAASVGLAESALADTYTRSPEHVKEIPSPSISPHSGVWQHAVLLGLTTAALVERYTDPNEQVNSEPAHRYILVLLIAM